MPVHSHFTDSAGRMQSTVSAFNGEISERDYFALATGTFSLGHHPSVGHVIPDNFRGMNLKVRAAYLEKIHDRVRGFFEAPREPFYVSCCHDGVHIFFASPIDKKVFL